MSPPYWVRPVPISSAPGEERDNAGRLRRSWFEIVIQVPACIAESTVCEAACAAHARPARIQCDNPYWDAHPAAAASSIALARPAAA
jgi:hypothetical protein